jgi:anti-sigma-K factor RskA
MKIEIPTETAKTLWKRVRRNWRFWTFLAAVAVLVLILRRLMARRRTSSLCED